jgi:transcriptional regulator with XRE-family HTH domain
MSDPKFRFTLELLTDRRRELGITHAMIAAHSGVSEPTVKRILGGRMEEASFANVMAIAGALGISIKVFEADAHDMRVRQARSKAERIAKMVQATSGLEGQGLDDSDYRRLVERTFHQLMAGSDRKLWSDD